jgi:putative transposase
LESKIAQAQRRGHRRQAKRLHRRATRRRQDALHKFSRAIVNRYQNIFMGDVSSPALSKTRMAKAVSDCAWGTLTTQLLYKGKHAGRCVNIVNERNTTRTCCSCRALTGPSGLNGLRVREWTCSECGTFHDRDENSAHMILLVGRKPPFG